MPAVGGDALHAGEIALGDADERGLDARAVEVRPPDRIALAVGPVHVVVVHGHAGHRGLVGVQRDEPAGPAAVEIGAADHVRHRPEDVIGVDRHDLGAPRRDEPPVHAGAVERRAAHVQAVGPEDVRAVDPDARQWLTRAEPGDEVLVDARAVDGRAADRAGLRVVPEHVGGSGLGGGRRRQPREGE